jgi:hypothetical protein
MVEIGQELSWLFCRKNAVRHAGRSIFRSFAFSANFTAVIAVEPLNTRLHVSTTGCHFFVGKPF